MPSSSQPADPGADAGARVGDGGWEEVFLAALRRTGNVSEAARAAGVCRSRCYDRRRRDTGFAGIWSDALEEAADRLEMEAFRRAVEGIGEDRFFRGDVVGRVTRYSDRLLMFLLKARRPDRFDGAQPRKDMLNDEHFAEELRRRMEGVSRLGDTGAD